MRLDGKVALITGGGSGIGAAVAERFVAEGARVCVTGRRQHNLDETVRSLPEGTAVACRGDVADEADVARMVSTTVEFGGRLDVLVNNAGISMGGSVTGADRGRWREIIDINLTGPFLLMQEVIPHMVAAGGGAIVNVSSLAGVRALPHAAAYSAAKAGLIMLTKQAALDYGSAGIRCNAVLPGAVKTPMMEAELRAECEALGLDVGSYAAWRCRPLPLGRYGEPREIADACLFLASEESSFITGVALLVDGGTAIVDVYGAAEDASLGQAPNTSAADG